MNIHIDDISVVFKFVLLVENSCFNVWFESCFSVIEARNLEAKDANGMLSTYLFIIAFISAYISLFYNIIWQWYVSFMFTFHHFYIFFLVKKHGMAITFCFMLPECSSQDSLKKTPNLWSFSRRRTFPMKSYYLFYYAPWNRFTDLLILYSFVWVTRRLQNYS